MKKSEINKLAKQLAKTNTASWDVICLLEDLLSNEIIEKIINNPEENNETIKQLIQSFNNIDKHDGDFIGLEMHGSDFQSFDTLINILKINGFES